MTALGAGDHVIAARVAVIVRGDVEGRQIDGVGVIGVGGRIKMNVDVFALRLCVADGVDGDEFLTAAAILDRLEIINVVGGGDIDVLAA